MVKKNITISNELYLAIEKGASMKNIDIEDYIEFLLKSAITNQVESQMNTKNIRIITEGYVPIKKSEDDKKDTDFAKDK